MKKLLLSIIAVCALSASYAQTYMFINSEKVFKSIDAYNEAIKTLDDMNAQYRQKLDDEYASIEEMYNLYQTQKAYLSETNRAARENAIIEKEQAASKYQEEIFGQNGQLITKRIEMIKPIQDKVFDAINKYAEANGYTLVLDVATNPNILFYSPSLDKTEEIINLVK